MSVAAPVRKARPPWWLLGLVVVVLGAAAIGNLMTGYRGREDPHRVRIEGGRLFQPLAAVADLDVGGVDPVAVRAVQDAHDARLRVVLHR